MQMLDAQASEIKIGNNGCEPLSRDLVPDGSRTTDGSPDIAYLIFEMQKGYILGIVYCKAIGEESVLETF
jgi:hypothetical protein